MPKPAPIPHVTLNVAMSADGKISTHRRETFSLGSRHDRHLMDVLRTRADAVVIGSGSVRLDGWAIRVRDTQMRARRVSRGRPSHPLNVVLSSRLELPAKCQFFEHRETEKLVFTTRYAPKNRIRRFERHAEVLVMPGKRVRPRDVLAELQRRGCRKVLVEGGGELNFSFFEEQLVDDLYITVTPRILGGRLSPSPVDGRGFLEDTQTRLELVSSRRHEDEVFLRYRVIKRQVR